MAHVVTESCHDCKYTDCCVVCPVECFYQDDSMLYIDPADCIDCEACVPECPVEAIYAEANLPAQWNSYVPAQWQSYVDLNKDRAAALKGSGHITDKHDPKEGPGCKAKA
jgi:ferredoxin